VISALSGRARRPSRPATATIITPNGPGLAATWPSCRPTWGRPACSACTCPRNTAGAAGLTELVIVTEELAAHGLPLLIAVISPAICGSILASHASPTMKASWLPGLADGTRRMAFALTEPDAGSNSHNVSTTARYPLPSR